MTACTCGGRDFASCLCGISPHDFHQAANGQGRMSDDTGVFFIVGHHRNGLPGARNLYLKRTYEDRQGNLRVRWTDDRYQAKAWRTEEAAQRNATHLGRVQRTFR